VLDDRGRAQLHRLDVASSRRRNWRSGSWRRGAPEQTERHTQPSRVARGSTHIPMIGQGAASHK
jgi:hypothetical protein